MITAFQREKEEYKTDELLQIIDNKILSHMSPKIAGSVGTATKVVVRARLLSLFALHALGADAVEGLCGELSGTLLAQLAGIEDGLKVEPIDKVAATESMGVQLLAHRLVTESAEVDGRFEQLAGADAPAMLALAKLTKPGQTHVQFHPVQYCLVSGEVNLNEFAFQASSALQTARFLLSVGSHG